MADKPPPPPSSSVVPPPRPGNWDKAWNDPPLFSAAQQQGVASGSSAGGGLKLTKRVGHTLTSGPATSTPPLSGSLPPPMMMPPLPPSTNSDRLHDAGAKPVNSALPPPPASAALKQTKNEETPSSQEPSMNVEELIGSLTETLDSLELETKKSQDIAKRISILETKWKSGSLNGHIENGLSSIATSLKESKFDEAEKVHTTMVVDWPPLCANWAVGLKHLISQAKEKAAKEAQTTEDEN